MTRPSTDRCGFCNLPLGEEPVKISKHSGVVHEVCYDNAYTQNKHDPVNHPKHDPNALCPVCTEALGTGHLSLLDVGWCHVKCANELLDVKKRANQHDPVNHPKHYTDHPSGIECIQVTRHMTFNLGNAVKYLWRAGKKDPTIQDLEKARWYILDEIIRLKREQGLELTAEEQKRK